MKTNQYDGNTWLIKYTDLNGNKGSAVVLTDDESNPSLAIEVFNRAHDECMIDSVKYLSPYVYAKEGESKSFYSTDY